MRLLNIPAHLVDSIYVFRWYETNQIVIKVKKQMKFSSSSTNLGRHTRTIFRRIRKNPVQNLKI